MSVFPPEEDVGSVAPEDPAFGVLLECPVIPALALEATSLLPPFEPMPPAESPEHDTRLVMRASHRTAKRGILMGTSPGGMGAEARGPWNGVSVIHLPTGYLSLEQALCQRKTAARVSFR